MNLLLYTVASDWRRVVANGLHIAAATTRKGVSLIMRAPLHLH